MPQLNAAAMAAAREPAALAAAEPMGALAVALLGYLAEGKTRPLLFLARSERRAEALARVLAALSPGLKVALFPAWDNLPYDRAPPSRAVMGQRAGVLRWLTDRAFPPDIVLTTPPAAIQRVPPQAIWDDAHTQFRVGEAIDLEAAERRLKRLGYTLDERVDAPGEAAMRGRVIDLFPAAAPMPCRIEHEDGRIMAIRSYDPVTQRSEAETKVLTLDPASEFIANTGDEEIDPSFEAEHSLAECYPELETLFTYVPDAPVVLDDDAHDRAKAFFGQIAEAYESRTNLRLGGARAPVRPEKLYMESGEWDRAIERRLAAVVLAPAEENRVPCFVRERGSLRRFAEYIAAQRRKGMRLVLCGASERDRRALARRAARMLQADVTPAANWAAVRAAEPGSVLALRLPISAGFVLPRERIVVIAAADLLGSRAATIASAERPDSVALPMGEIEFRLGDAVVHLDHGMGILEGLEDVAAGTAGAGDTLRLRYAHDTTLMVPVEEIGKVWRYGSDPSAVSLDRLDGEAWRKRRAEVKAEIERTAARMVELARIRDETPAPKLVPSARDYERFAARFRFNLTPDQAAAVDAVLDDLASGRPMDRLVCGDVGFGKTEVALRAAAAAVFAGRQVAVIAPTTVLVRQHLRTFRRRFEPFGIEVAHLSRLVKPAQARDVKEGLASGAVRLVIGTHALAGKAIGFHDLGLVAIDEEQRFGARNKRRLRTHAKAAHVLTLTATPIPRTLQSALVGLQDLSVIATPPIRRQPIRTLLVPFDAFLVRDALMREKKRGGQSFVVCPRVDDIAPMKARLREIVPELDVMVAHGKMPADEMDDVMVRFADGEGDVLLATNIIESGLDVPRANTMLVWRADRFGLAQLHQLRGRVGRGTRRGVAYLLADPGEKLAPATEKRLRTLEDLDRLGAGFAISARDLDMRGAGDLMGEEQAGHVKLIGLGFYQHLLGRAIRAARGENVENWTPVIHLGLQGRIPEDYVPEAEVRISLYARLDGLADADEIAAFEDEIDDRFGPHPEPVAHLFLRARLRSLCREAGIARLDGGPQAIAATPREAPFAERLARLEDGNAGVRWSGERFIFPHGSDDAAERARLATKFLNLLATWLERAGPASRFPSPAAPSPEAARVSEPQGPAAGLRSGGGAALCGASHRTGGACGDFSGQASGKLD